MLGVILCGLLVSVSSTADDMLPTDGLAKAVSECYTWCYDYMNYNYKPVKEYADHMIEAGKLNVVQSEADALRGKTIVCQDERPPMSNLRLSGVLVDRPLDQLDRYLHIVGLIKSRDVNGLLACVYDEACGSGESSGRFSVREESFSREWTLQAACKGIAAAEDEGLSHLLGMVSSDASEFKVCMRDPGIYGLGESKNPKAVEILYDLVSQVPKPRGPRERDELQNIVYALGNSRLSSAIDRLLDLIDRREELGMNLGSFLDSLALHGDEAVLHGLAREAQRAGFVAGSKDIAPTAILKEALQSEDVEVRRAVCEGFRRVRKEWGCFPDYLPSLEKRLLGEEQDNDCLVSLAQCLCNYRFPESRVYAESALKTVPFPAKMVAFTTLLPHSHARAVALALQVVRKGEVPVETQAELLDILLSAAREREAIPLAIDFLDKHSAIPGDFPALGTLANRLCIETGQDFGFKRARNHGDSAGMQKAIQAYRQWWDDHKDSFKFPPRPFLGP